MRRSKVQAKEKNPKADAGVPSSEKYQAANEAFQRAMEQQAAEQRKAEARAQVQVETMNRYVSALAALASAVEHLASQLDKLTVTTQASRSEKASRPAEPRAERQPANATPAEVSRKDVGAALVALTKVKGSDAAFAVLERHGAKTLSDLPVEKYAAVLNAALALASLTAGVTK